MFLKALGDFIDSIFKPLNALFSIPRGDGPKLVDKALDYQARGSWTPLEGLEAPALTVVAALANPAGSEASKRVDIEEAIRDITREGSAS